MEWHKRTAAACGMLAIACLGMGVGAAPAGGFNGPEKGEIESAFIPDGYEVAGRAEADFNHDRIADLVMVLQKKGGKEEVEGAPRWLVILFRRADGRCVLSLKSSRAVPASGSGLRADEEFAGPWALNDTFKVRHGFSDGRSGVTSDYQFRFRNGAWHVIGKRSEFLGEVGRPQVPMDETIAWTSRVVDENYLTGTRVETWSCAGCEDPEIKLTLTYRGGERAATLQEFFEPSERGGDEEPLGENNEGQAG